VCAQVEPQLIPAGLELTVPEPVPDVLTLNVSEKNVKAAVTDLAWLMLRMQLPVPEQSPDQPEKAEPVAGVAVSVTVEPVPKEREHVEPQLMAAGLEVTVPEPVPDFVTLTVNPQTSIAAFCVPHCGVPKPSGLSTVSMLVPQTRHALLGSGDAPA